MNKNINKIIKIIHYLVLRDNHVTFLKDSGMSLHGSIIIVVIIVIKFIVEKRLDIIIPLLLPSTTVMDQFKIHIWLTEVFF